MSDANSDADPESGAVEVGVGARLAMDHSTVQYAKGNGLFVNQNVPLSEFAQNHFEQDDTPISIKASDIGALDTGTTFAGNKNNWVLVHSNDADLPRSNKSHRFAMRVL